MPGDQQKHYALVSSLDRVNQGPGVDLPGEMHPIMVPLNLHMALRKVTMDQKLLYRLAYLPREEQLLVLFFLFAQMPLTKTTHSWSFQYLRS